MRELSFSDLNNVAGGYFPNYPFPFPIPGPINPPLPPFGDPIEPPVIPPIGCLSAFGCGPNPDGPIVW